MHKLMQVLGLKPVEPKELAIENLAANTLTMADEVSRRRRSFEELGFPFAEAMELTKKGANVEYQRTAIDD